MSRGSTIGMVLVGVVAAGGAGAYFFVVKPKIDNARLIHQNGTAHGSVLVDNTVILLDAVDITNRTKSNDPATPGTYDYEDIARTRVTVVDATTGKQLMQKLIDAFGGCQPASPGRAWCDFDGKLALYDTKTFAVVTKLDDAVKKANLGHPVDKQWRIESGAAIQLLDDGRVAIVDPATLAVRREDTPPQSLHRDPMGSPAQPGKVQMTMHCDDLVGGRDMATMRARFAQAHGSAEDFLPPGMQKKQPKQAGPTSWTIKATGERGSLVKGGVTSKETYLSPALVDTNDAPMVVHHSSLDAERDHLQLSRLDPSGANKWTVDLGAPRCELAEQVGSLFVITTTSADHRALAIDPETGAVRWNVGF